MSRTVTRLAAGIVAGGLALAISACSPVLTMKPYASSDGARISWGEGVSDVRGENVIILAGEQGGEGRMVGGLTNTTGEAVTVTFGFDGGVPQEVTIDPRSTVLLDGSAERDVILTDVPVAPGSTATMRFETPSLGSVTLPIPVLDGTLGEYADLVP